MLFEAITALGGAAVIFAAIRLIYPIIFPPIIKYPWPRPVIQEDNNKSPDKKMTVVLAGSYNPPHCGHLAMLTYLSQRYGKVIAVVGMNPNKKYPVSPMQRVELIRKMVKHSKTPLPNVEVQVVQGYIWRSVKRQGARIFFRGIRSWNKDGAEERQLQILNTWGPLLLGPLWWPIPTVYLEGQPEFNHVSSTLVREVSSSLSSSSSRELLEKLVPASIANDVARLYGK